METFIDALFITLLAAAATSAALLFAELHGMMRR